MRNLLATLAVVLGIASSSNAVVIVPDVRYLSTVSVTGSWTFAPTAASVVPITITGVAGQAGISYTGTTPAAVSSGNGTNAGKALSFQSAALGGATSDTTNGSTGGIGEGYTLFLGAGGAATGATGNVNGGVGGAFTVSGGNGGASNTSSGTTLGGNGGQVNFTTGIGGGASATGTGGNGGNMNLTANNGGNSAGTNGNGGTITLKPGLAGSGAGGAGTAGLVVVKAPGSSFGNLFQVQNSLGTGTFTVTDAGALTISGGSPNVSLANGTITSTVASGSNTGFTLNATNGPDNLAAFQSGGTTLFLMDNQSKALWLNGGAATNNSRLFWARNSTNSYEFASGIVGVAATEYSNSSPGDCIVTPKVTTASLLIGPSNGSTISPFAIAATFSSNTLLTSVLTAGAAPASVAGNGTNATNPSLTGSTGGASSGSTGQTGGTGSTWTITGGAGGAVAGASGIGGAGGATNLTAGNGGNGAATGGAGGTIGLTAGNAGTGGNANGGSVTLTTGTATGSGTLGQIVLNQVTAGTAGVVIQGAGTTTSTFDTTNARLRVGDATAPAATLDIAGKLQVTGSTGVISKYNNIATTGWGVPGIYASGNATAAATAVASVATYTPASDGTFVVGGFVNVTAWTTPASFNFEVTYTDEAGNSTTQIMTVSPVSGAPVAAITAVGRWMVYSGSIRAKGTNAITIKTAGTFTGSPTYDVYGWVAQTQN